MLGTMTASMFIIGMIFLVDTILLLLVALIVLRKDPGNLLHRIVALAMIFFSGYLLFEGLIQALPIAYFPYFDILRDISAIGALSASTCGALSGINLLKGDYYVTRIRVLAPFIAICLIGIILTLPNDTVFYLSHLDMIGYSMNLWSMLGLFLVPAVLMLFAAYCFARTLRTINRDHPKFRKALALPIAMILITVGIAYTSLTSMGGLLPPIYNIPGHAFFLVPSALFYYAFR